MTGEKMKIGFLGLSPGAGAGFVAVNFARHLAERNKFFPAVVELGSGGLYDSLGLDKRFAGSDFFPFHQAVADNRSIRGKRNEYLGVNWIVQKTDDKLPDYGFPRKLRLANNGAGNPLLCRLSGIDVLKEAEVLWEMDRIVLVIDPLPSCMLPAYDFLCTLRKEALPLFFLINKWNGGVDRKELLRYLGIREVLYLPIVPPETVYSAEYACRAVYDTASGRELLERPLSILSENLLDFSGDKVL